jgi:hypothetical protein
MGARQRPCLFVFLVPSKEGGPVGGFMRADSDANAVLIGGATTGAKHEADLEVGRRRQLLFSARMRFSPETQSIRQQAVDRIIEQNLALCDEDTGLSVWEIQDRRVVALPDGTAVLPREEIQAGLKRLALQGRVVPDGKDPCRYKVNDHVRSEVWALQDTCEQRLASVVGRLFKGAKPSAGVYAKPFMDCLCLVFSRLGEAYVRQIKHEISADELLNQPHVSWAFKKIKALYPFIDERHFQSAVFTFFRDEHPEYSALKWNLGQNYFVAKCLGLDPGGRLLSKEVFGDADIYLDTNVIIAAIEPGAQHHPSFEVLANACAELNIHLHACQISIDELRKVVSFEREALAKVVDKIPDATAPKVRGILFPVYYREIMAGHEASIDDIFEYFSEPSTMLKTFYNVEIIDDRWFIDNLAAPEIQRFSQEIKEQYETRPGRHKSEKAADHDALLLKWVQRERQTVETNAWIVTLDHSLPAFASPSKQGSVPLAIRLDSLLQWLSPIALQADDGQDRAAVIFSEALKYNLLPQESFFELGDFLAFAEWEWDTKALPAEDIEGCIRCVKTALPHLNPSDPADREKMSREFNKFLRDPGRKYKGEIERLEARAEQLAREKQEASVQFSKTRDELGDQLSEANSELEAAQSEIRNSELRTSATWRLLLTVALWVLVEAVLGYVTIQFGDGDNAFQKLKGAWELLAFPIPCAIGLTWFILGKDRIRALGWPLGKLLSGSDDK